MPISTVDITAADLPVHIGQVELDEPLQAHEVAQPEVGQHYRRARLLVRLHRAPLGYVVLPTERLEPEEVAKAIWDQLGDLINDHLAADGLDAVGELPLDGLAPGPALCHQAAIPLTPPLVTVVVCTRNRPAGAAAVLRNLVDLDYEPFEVVLVDNAPSDGATREVVEEEFGHDPRVRYVLEPAPGLSRARNRGLREANGEIVAYTDDDTLVDRDWLKGIVRGFNRAERVGCVTGLVPTAELRNEIQLFFDQRVAWGSSCQPKVYDMGAHRPDSVLFPFAGSDFGTGANFAFRREALLQSGGFDEALGAGAPTGGGEDLDAFVKVLLGGWKIVYEPTAIIGHIHRAEVAALSKQMFTYGSGLTAFLAKYLINPRTGFKILKAVPAGVRKAANFSGQSNSAAVSLPRGVAYRELVGMASGPFLYAKARWQLRSGR